MEAARTTTIKVDSGSGIGNYLAMAAGGSTIITVDASGQILTTPGGGTSLLLPPPSVSSSSSTVVSVPAVPPSSTVVTSEINPGDQTMSLVFSDTSQFTLVDPSSATSFLLNAVTATTNNVEDGSEEIIHLSPAETVATTNNVEDGSEEIIHLSPAGTVATTITTTATSTAAQFPLLVDERDLLGIIHSDINNEERIMKPIGKGPYKCEICEAEFKVWAALKRHTKGHENDKRYRCPHCEASYNLEKNRRLHLATHQKDNLICPECGRKFGRYASFKSHLSIHEEEDNLSCPECEEEFMNELQLNRHLSQQHQINPSVFVDRRSCRHCGADNFHNASALKQHISEHTKIRSLTRVKQKRNRSVFRGTFQNKCKHCGKKFKKPSQCERHERIHTGVKPFQCNICDRAFNQKNSLDMHLRKHTGEKPFTCDICSTKFTQNGNLRAHISRVHSIPNADDQVFRCEECPCLFRKIGSLNAHISKVHVKSSDLLSQALASTGLKGENQDSNDDYRGKQLVVIADKTSDGKIRKHLVKVHRMNGVKYHECNHCTKEFKKPSDLCRHLKTHSLEKPFKCKCCSRSFSVKSALLVHSRIHNNNSNVCSICNKKFPNAVNLRMHKRTHIKKSSLKEPYIVNEMGVVMETVLKKSSKERHHRCPFCPASFKKPSQLKSHTKIHSGEKPYSCADCQKAFVSKGSLNAHVKNAHERSGYQCAKCLLSFSTAGSVRRHMSSYHSEQRPFVCPYCQKSFKTNALCKRHIQTHDEQEGKQSEQQSQPQPQQQQQQPQLQEHVTEVVANVSSEGIVTINPGDLGIELPNINTISDLATTIYTCITCNQDFTGTEEIQQHLANHKTIDDELQSSKIINETPLAPAEVPSAPEKNEFKKVVVRISEDEEKALASTPIEKARTISEKILLASVSEKNRVSEIKSLEEELREKPVHANKCYQCPKSFKKPSDLNRHIRTHTGEKPYPCNICGKRFTVKSTLLVHRRVHGGAKGIHCHICGVLFSSKSSLKVHMRLHTGARPYKCPHCDERFRTPGHRKAHMSTHNTTTTTTVSPPTQQQPLVTQPPPPTQPLQEPQPQPPPPNQPTSVIPLSIPAESITQALDAVTKAGEPLIGATVKLQLQGSGLETALAHLQVDENLLQQLQNGENINVIINPLELQQSSSNPPESAPPQPQPPPQQQQPQQQQPPQENIFGTEVVQICPWCDGVFSNEEDHSTHLLEAHGIDLGVVAAATAASGGSSNNTTSSSSNNPPSSSDRTCHLCHKKFSKPSQLQRHMRVHTGERPFSCMMCMKAFNQKNALQIHMKKHTGERPYICPFCSYAFTQKGNLKTHIQRSHSEQAQELLDKAMAAEQQQQEMIVDMSDFFALQ